MNILNIFKLVNLNMKFVFFSTLDLVMYEEIANTTLDLLAEFLESLSDDGMCPEDFDVYLSVGAKATFIW